MQNDNAYNLVNNHLSVISLKRTPQRLNDFYRRNAHTLKDWNVHLLEGIDGTQQTELFKKSRLVSSDVLKGWTPGAIGSALSHMLSWRLCIQLGKPLLVVEDDAILAKTLKKNLKILLQSMEHQPPFLLLGWNLDSLLQAELEPGLGLISLFEPAYPDESHLKKLVNSPFERRACKLKRCFGLPAYRITPETAQTLLDQLNPLTAEEIPMGRGIPTHYTATLDGILNNQYQRIRAKVVFPPMALAVNNQAESLTRNYNTPLQFKN